MGRAGRARLGRVPVGPALLGRPSGAAGDRPVVRVLDPGTGRVARETGPAPGPPWLALTPGGRVLAGGLTSDGAAGVGFWDPADGRLLSRLGGTEYDREGVFNPSGRSSRWCGRPGSPSGASPADRGRTGGSPVRDVDATPPRPVGR
jgi:hypothetical protein